MFSVDNFYDFMDSHYGLLASDQNLLMAFRIHGSKDFYDLAACRMDIHESLDKLCHWSTKNQIILHDQEPFDPTSLDIYKHMLVHEQNHQWRQSLTRKQMLTSLFPFSIGWPIFCHSEMHSDDIRYLDQLGIITCYYFWHGLISRDWFRHWKHHAQISPTKSWQYRFLLYARDCTGSRQYRQQLIDDLAGQRDTVDHDWDNTKNISSDFSAKIDPADAARSAIHLVAETVFDRNKIHLTEKSFKPIVMMQPFILFAGAGSLAYLRHYGFKTFGDLWDESYDLETDHQKRYHKAMMVIRSLTELDSREFDLILQKARPILEHNHRRFFSEEFEAQMLLELHTNMAQGLERARRQTQDQPGGGIMSVLDLFQDRTGDIPAHVSEHMENLMQHLSVNDPERYIKIRQHHPWWF